MTITAESAINLVMDQVPVGEPVVLVCHLIKRLARVTGTENQNQKTEKSFKEYFDSTVFCTMTVIAYFTKTVLLFFRPVCVVLRKL